jgi:hypothetical protein
MKPAADGVRRRGSGRDRRVDAGRPQVVAGQEDAPERPLERRLEQVAAGSRMREPVRPAADAVLT